MSSSLYQTQYLVFADFFQGVFSHEQKSIQYELSQVLDFNLKKTVYLKGL